MKLLTLSSLVVLSSLMIGCSSDSSTSETGTMSLRLTDAPINGASSVVVQFSGVSILGDEEDQKIDFTFDEPKSIDLLDLQGSATATLFADEEITAGVYKEIRLIVDAVAGVKDTYLVIDGQEHEMTVPSGSTSGLKLKGDFNVPAGQSANFTIDFDVLKSIVKSGNANSANGVKYHLKPVLRIVDDTEIGHIEGTVAAELLLDDATAQTTCSDDDVDTFNSVYIFAGSDITADDINVVEGAVQPIASALVSYDVENEVYSYQIGFLTAGDYSVSFTCNADIENIETDDELEFLGTQNVTIIANETATANF